MSLITITSENPNFSYLLQKNPVTSPLVMRGLKHGTLFGFYSEKSPDTYLIYFRDGDDEVSFPQSQDESFEYLNVTRYNSSLFIFNAVKELLGHLENNKYNDAEKDVEGFTTTLVINMVHLGVPKYLKFFSNTLKGFDMTYEQLVGKEYRVTIKTQKKMHELVNYVSLLGLFLVLINENEYLFIDEKMIERFIKVMNNIDAQYYIRYLFKLRVINQSPKLFGKYMKELEKCSTQKIIFKSGDTHQQRIDFAVSQFQFMFSLIDIGAGEGRYSIPFAKKVGHVHSVDIDEPTRKTLEHNFKKKGIANYSIHSSIDELNESLSGEVPFDVLCTEVIEHLELSDVEALLEKIVNIKNAQRILITTPNADFNKFYSLEGFRHDDHKFEMNEIEFNQYMIDFISKYEVLENFNFKFVGIGDSVDGIHVTQGIIFTRHKFAK